MSERLCKICGLTRPEDVRLCHSLGVDFTGFIFAARSPRRISPEFAAALPAGPSRRVGVFAGSDPDEVLGVAETARLDYLQLHGGEEPDFCRTVGPERVIKVFWPQALSPGALAAEMDRFAPVAAYFLLDAGGAGGGSGNTLDWAALRTLNAPRPWFLAGGLGPETLDKALALCSAAGVDLNSALESGPGLKDHKRVRQAVLRLRAATGTTRQPLGKRRTAP